jgi:hypothetical protein
VVKHQPSTLTLVKRDQPPSFEINAHVRAFSRGHHLCNIVSGAKGRWDRRSHPNISTSIARSSLSSLFSGCGPTVNRLTLRFSRLAVTEFWVLRYAITQVMSREGPILPRNGTPVHSHLSGLYSAPAATCSLGCETRGEFGILRQGASEPLCAKIGDLHT